MMTIAESCAVINQLEPAQRTAVQSLVARLLDVAMSDDQGMTGDEGNPAENKPLRDGAKLLGQDADLRRRVASARAKNAKEFSERWPDAGRVRVIG